MPDSMKEWPPPAAIMTFADGDPAENPWVSGAPPVEAIEIVDYSPEWPVLFEASRQLIVRTLPGIALGIEHIGSTAIPNLAAKPIIDIDLIVADPTRELAYVPALADIGFVLTVRERSWYEHRMLRHEQPRINLHVFGRNCAEHVRHILFRDWLRTHPEDCARYTRVKEEARIGVTNVRDYNRNKETVVRDIYATIFESHGWAP
ncbi:GrpB family protein [Bradyrhizobium sp. SZCCHNRI2049]|uniref:GrpB family protein n=1 Tax=Bradyrhizobium sp. SZCCHNRI2049 TaxID=3057287 RepID=UPI0029163B5C|nr:GrpB family protein [Bradyrhizobium sp. SZCCHNRI2049]